MTLPRVVILGGGMAGLTTAWELSAGPWRERFASITVHQRGWRLGGKGASSRGPHGRIEEHGLHVLLGYYDATFRVLREVYAELDRERTDPSCPLRTWRDAFTPTGDVGLADRDDSGWDQFVTRFTGNDLLPGEPGAEDRRLLPADLALRAVRLLADFHAGLAAGTPHREEVVLSASPVHPGATPGQGWGPPAGGPGGGGGPHPEVLARGAGLTAVAALLEVLDRGSRLASGWVDLPVADTVATVLHQWRDAVRGEVLADADARRTWQLVDLVATNVVGLVADGLLLQDSYARIDHLDYREWLARHGASPETLDSPVVRGMYDLVFAYEEGDRSRPRFAAGLGLQLAGRMLLDFKGAVFWRMQAGMGEAVFAPIHEALRRRGVDIRFFSRLTGVHPDPDGRHVVALDLERQADLAAGRTAYEPLVRASDGLPCWPDGPLVDQLSADPGPDAESHGAPRREGATERLEAGRDFDVAVLAVSVGMIPHVAPDLLAASPRWRSMVEHVATVGTRSAQLWLTTDEAGLGWTGPRGVTLTGFGDTFDTWAAMSHLLPREEWTPGSAPGTVAYLCGAMADAPAAGAADSVRADLRRFLDEDVAELWPAAAGPDGFRWDLLHDDEARAGADRLRAQYVRANLDPSDRYVQSLPGSGRFRIPPGDTGFTNLAVAGDWTACGLDAGCLEAATRSGVLAARAVLDGTVHPVSTSGTPA